MLRGARPKGSAKPTKGLYTKRGTGTNKKPKFLRGGTPGKGTVFKSTKDVIAEKKKKPIRKPNLLEKMKATKTRKEMLDPMRNITIEQGLDMIKKNLKVEKSRGGIIDGNDLVSSFYEKG